MSDYHSQEAFDARLAARRANPQVPLPLRVFYHISCMGNWQEVVTEQLRLLAHVGLKEATACLLGTKADAAWIGEKAESLGIALFIHNVVNNLSLYERPTLDLLYEWVCANPTASVLYFHTKGVSAPHDAHKKAWRRLMQKHVIADWRANLNKLAVADVLGVSWQELRDFPHFCGNFWMARCDWIARLQRPSEYRYSRPPFRWAGHSWNKRMFVETWIGSKNYHHVESLVCRNGCFWDGDQIFSYDLSIPGFSYDGSAAMIPAILNWMKDTLNRHNMPVGDVLEVGSKNVNGAARTVFQQQSKSYIGVDMEEGDGVDVVTDAHDLRQRFDGQLFDTIICCETLEHMVHPWVAVEQMKLLLRPGGHLWISTPTFGFPEHRYPIDCYRFGEDAYRQWLFADMDLLSLGTVYSGSGNESCLVAVGRKK